MRFVAMWLVVVGVFMGMVFDGFWGWVSPL